MEVTPLEHSFDDDASDNTKLFLPNYAYTTDWRLWVVAACMLAADFLDNNPHPLDWWWRTFTFYDGETELLTMSEAKIKLLKCIHWTMHTCASDQAMEAARQFIPPLVQ
ncbi:hypothetical protein AC578_5981 [Pseudocercospora eumusae]|uniref:Cyclin N-terminal domain-containing protein n=1 Tax=Pseudocercospora eumusae TaxID=321146 RepID=A0A139HIA6_9PEZI|nr:hypothetical protein AC578_5981 [Pseudocercospora eumusae]